MLTASSPLPRARSPFGIVAAHELVHLFHRVDDSDSWFWLHEGFTRYFEFLASLRADGAPDAARVAGIIELAASAQAKGAGRPLEKARDGFAYDGGALAAFCVDTELRAAGTSLSAVRRQARGTGVSIAGPAFLAARSRGPRPHRFVVMGQHAAAYGGDLQSRRRRLDGGREGDGRVGVTFHRGNEREARRLARHIGAARRPRDADDVEDAQ